MNRIVFALVVLNLIVVPAGAAGPGCICTDGYGNPATGSVTCTQWDCDPIVLGAPFTQVKSEKDCPDNRQLFCDGKKCVLGCPVEEKQKAPQ